VTAAPGPWVARLEELDRRLDAAEVSARGALSPRALEKASAAIQAEQADVRRRLGRLTALATMEPYLGRPGQLRTSWPQLTLDQRWAVLAAVLERVVVHPALQPGRPTFDPRRVEVCWRKTDPAERRVVVGQCVEMQLAG
jgi:predicted Fe-S protein YdhL (DUF1289 family)